LEDKELRGVQRQSPGYRVRKIPEVGLRSRICEQAFVTPNLRSKLYLFPKRANNLILCNTNHAETGTRKGAPVPVNVLYRTSAKATGGRDGHAATLDGALDVKLATPKELGGGGGAGNNPEQLFAAGYAACFIGAMKFVASQGGPKVPADASVTSTVGIGPRSAGGFGLEIALDVSLPGVPRAEAEALVEKAHQVCPYSNATRGNVDVRLKVV
jgi:Ohr subfamily peroxiredoxin